jgi:hypothetical protein
MTHPIAAIASSGRPRFAASPSGLVQSVAVPTLTPLTANSVRSPISLVMGPHAEEERGGGEGAGVTNSAGSPPPLNTRTPPLPPLKPQTVWDSDFLRLHVL